MTHRRLSPTFATRLIVCFLLACSVPGSARQTSSRQATNPNQKPEDSLIQIFEAYDQAQYPQAVAMLQQMPNAGAIRNALKDRASKWIAAAPEVTDRRRHITALVTLEAAHLAFTDHLGKTPSSKLGLPDELNAERELLEFGCQLLRQGQPTEFEHVWQLASIALVQSVQNDFWYSFTRNARPSGNIYLLIDNKDDQHLGHARARFPAEPRFDLATVLTYTEARRMPNRPGVSATFMTLGISDDDAADIYDVQAVPVVQRTIDRLTRLVNVPRVGPEAQMRRAILWFHRGDLAQTLRDAGAAARSDADPVVRYLGHFFTGMALDHLDRRGDAIEAYREALKVVPGAQSGVLALAADLLLANRGTEAGSLMEAAFATSGPTDPWRMFSLGDFRFWPDYLARLREAVRQ